MHALRGIAMFANLVPLNWSIDSESKVQRGSQGSYVSTDMPSNRTFIFTASGGLKYSDELHSQFWPFVKFSSSTERVYYSSARSGATRFNGIFYRFDYTEFLFYMLLMLGVFYIKDNWSESDTKQSHSH